MNLCQAIANMRAERASQKAAEAEDEATTLSKCRDREKEREPFWLKLLLDRTGEGDAPPRSSLEERFSGTGRERHYCLVRVLGNKPPIAETAGTWNTSVKVSRISFVSDLRVCPGFRVEW